MKIKYVETRLKNLGGQNKDRLTEIAGTLILCTGSGKHQERLKEKKMYRLWTTVGKRTALYTNAAVIPGQAARGKYV